jgi:hypothetical protein
MEAVQSIDVLLEGMERVEASFRRADEPSSGRWRPVLFFFFS